MISSWKESRIDCWKIIFFDDLGFGVNTKEFRKLRTTEEINNFCIENCEDVKCETRVRILNIISKIENDKIKNDQL